MRAAIAASVTGITSDTHHTGIPQTAVDPYRRSTSISSTLASANAPTIATATKPTATLTTAWMDGDSSVTVARASNRSLLAASAAPRNVIHSVRYCTAVVPPGRLAPNASRPARSTSGIAVRATSTAIDSAFSARASQESGGAISATTAAIGDDTGGASGARVRIIGAVRRQRGRRDSA